MHSLIYRFVKTLEDDEVIEGDSVTITCTTSTPLSSAAQKPEFTKPLSDQEAEEGDSLTLSCKTQNIDSAVKNFPPKFVTGKSITFAFISSMFHLDLVLG